jgi:hypothetical protein
MLAVLIFGAIISPVRVSFTLSATSLNHDGLLFHRESTGSFKGCLSHITLQPVDRGAFQKAMRSLRWQWADILSVDGTPAARVPTKIASLTHRTQANAVQSSR